MTLGMPDGAKIPTNFGPCFTKPRMKTLKKVSTASVAVTASWAVTAKVRSRPPTLPIASTPLIRFRTRMTRKSVKM